MNIFFARHAESEANVKYVISNRGMEHPLTERGRNQAEELAETLKNEAIVGIFCSPIERAVETARIVGNKLNIPVAKADALREFDAGVMEGRSDEEAWFEIGRAMRMWLENGDVDYRILEGESLKEVQHRFNEFISKLVALGGDESYLLISHGGTFRMTIPYIFHELPESLYKDRFFNYTEYAKVEVLNSKLICTEWCGQKVN